MLTIPIRQRSALAAEWPAFCVAMFILAALLGAFSGLGQADRMVYDWLTRHSGRDAAPEVVIVAIDDVSIAALGRWPWPRARHAQLLQILAQGGARAVGLDIILSEASGMHGESDDDALLAAAIRSYGRVVLPVVFGHGAAGMTPILPLPPFANASAGLGYTHFGFDPDGIVRTAFLGEGIAGGTWLQFALSVYRAGRPEHDLTAGINPVSSSHSAWVRAFPKRIPYAGPPGHFRRVSYVDVLSGKVRAGEFSGKYVLVGTMAPGLTSAFNTPYTDSHGAMAGIEIHANILAGLLNHAVIDDARPWQSALFSMMAALLSLIACRYLSPVRALMTSLALAGMVLAASWMSFRLELWLAPAAACISVLVVYPLWNWRRLEAAVAFLSEEFARLNRETTIDLSRDENGPRHCETDYLDRRIGEMRLAARRARDMQRFVVDSLDSMPDPTLVLSPAGKVILHNRAAGRSLALEGRKGDAPVTLDDALAGVRRVAGGVPTETSWRQALLHPGDGATVTMEARDDAGREYLVKAAESRQPDGKTIGWIVALVDVTPLRTAERARDESLRFISHDMRAPQASILALIELQKNPATAFSQDEFFSRIEKSVQSTLGLADDFVHLAKAESAAYQLQDADMPSMLADAADEMWAYARSCNVEVVIDAEINDDWVNVDRPLMVRALGNLISNAIKFSRPAGRVVCRTSTVTRNGKRYVTCDIEDWGIGIPLEEHSRIFSPFVRGSSTGRGGVGLGLVFVKTVVERHGGIVGFTSRPGESTVFTVALPCIGEVQNETGATEIRAEMS